MATADLPPPDLLAIQAGWLAPARRWLLERANLSSRRAVLDLGCGSGAVTVELAQGSGGLVVALDRQWGALSESPAAFGGAGPLCADAGRLPLAGGAFDLVFCQLALLWMPLDLTLVEVWRVLEPGGVLVALEPDYGGMIEYPPGVATRDLWADGLRRAGADPRVGRKLPGALAQLGFAVHVNLFNELLPPSPTRFELLRGLPLTPSELRRLARAEAAAQAMTLPWQQVAHLPFMLVTATKPDTRAASRATASS